MNFEEIARTALSKDQRRRSLDMVLFHLEEAERILNNDFGGVGVRDLDDCRQALIDDEF